MWSRRTHCRIRRYIAVLGAGLLMSAPAAAQPLLNEIVAANQEGITDEDGDHIDWIEIFNAGAVAVDLADHGLSDDPAAPFKWRFPPLAIGPTQRLVVFASGKDRVAAANHLETVIDHGAPWRYRPGDSEPPADWRTLEFDDSGWEEGPSGFGYGDGDDATLIDPTISLYLRRRIVVADPSAVGTIYLHVDVDDGFVAYVNDVEVARTNVGQPGDHPPHDQTADRELEAWIYRGRPPQLYEVDANPATLLAPGLNVVALQVHNVSLASGDMTMIPFLTLTLEAPPASPVGAPDILRPSLPHLHTSFKLRAEGESLVLTSDAGALLDRVDDRPLVFDVSRGRYPDGAPFWYLFDPPTPDAANQPGYAGFAALPEFSVPPGFHGGGLSVAISCPSPTATIFYTLGGGEPNDSSTVYTQPVTIAATTVLRARAYAPGLLPGAVATATYLLDEEVALPTISLVTDPPNLWDENHGIYVMGPFASSVPPHFGANFWQDWERPIHLEYFEPGGGPGLHLDAGVKIFGGFSRARAQKSLRIIARGGYGASSIVYPLFAELGIDEFKQLVLRNAGNDWCKAHLRDAVIHRMLTGAGLAGADIDRQAYEPTVVFLNGEYWGIHNLRERQDKHYLESHHGVDPDNIDLLEAELHEIRVIEGDSSHYLDMIQFINTHPLALGANYQVVQTMMDTDNFAEYCVFEIYFNNPDWPHNNKKWWRPRTPAGRWNWLLFDIDLGLGLHDVNFDMMYWSTEGSTAYGTHLFNALLDNAGFERSFLNRYADHLNATLRPERLQALLDTMEQTVAPEMARHMIRWGRTIEFWNSHVAVAHNFIEQRPVIARGHVIDHFQLAGTWMLTLDVSPPGTGRIRLTAVEIDSTWSGVYFLGVPVSLTAAPAPGHAFAGWSDPLLPPEPSVEIDPGADYDVTALFVPGDSVVVVINEINYNSAPAFDPGDWVELHNPGAAAMDLAGWRFKDSDDLHVFEFQPPTGIASGGHLVLTRDGAAFQVLFPDVENVVGDLSFGLSGAGELVRLFDAGGTLVDWVEYDDAPPWPTAPDGGGPTLELIAPAANNALPESWAASLAAHGTPGEANSVSPTTAAAAAGALVAFYVEPAFPNPFNPRTTLRFGLPAAGPVRLAIFDVSGRLVRQLLAGPLSAGHHRVTWDGRNDQGRRVASAVYFYELRAPGASARRKLVLVQ